eukprot:GHVU01000898.1.p1 GENE.GHVU01000898.1~~GHVU01000898.1.p1  ORF type:complete len:533 (-),score=25.01 GHVU01000898.1:798-2396(-)
MSGRTMRSASAKADGRVVESEAEPGARRIPMIGDGMCLYRAISHQLYGTADRYLIVREALMGYMLSHPDDVAEGCRHDIILSEAREILESTAAVRHYVETSPHRWGGEVEVYAASQLYGIQVFRYESPTNNTSVLYPGRMQRIPTQDQDVIRLYFNGLNHYDSVVIDGDVTSAGRVTHPLLLEPPTAEAEAVAVFNTWRIGVRSHNGVLIEDRVPKGTISSQDNMRIASSSGGQDIHGLADDNSVSASACPVEVTTCIMSECDRKLSYDDKHTKRVRLYSEAKQVCTERQYASKEVSSGANIRASITSEKSRVIESHIMQLRLEKESQCIRAKELLTQYEADNIPFSDAELHAACCALSLDELIYPVSKDVVEDEVDMLHTTESIKEDIDASRVCDRIDTDVASAPVSSIESDVRMTYTSDAAAVQTTLEFLEGTGKVTRETLLTFRALHWRWVFSKSDSKIGIRVAVLLTFDIPRSKYDKRRPTYVRVPTSTFGTLSAVAEMVKKIIRDIAQMFPNIRCANVDNIMDGVDE